MAENCATGTPEELVVLQPVQLVSMDVAGGEMEKVPLDEVVVGDEPPPQPAARRSAGNMAAARSLAGHRLGNEQNPAPPLTFKRRRPSAVTDPWSLNSFSALPNLLSAPTASDTFNDVSLSPR
jgi:hypothetical protein